MEIISGKKSKGSRFDVEIVPVPETESFILFDEYLLFK